MNGDFPKNNGNLFKSLDTNQIPESHPAQLGSTECQKWLCTSYASLNVNRRQYVRRSFSFCCWNVFISSKCNVIESASVGYLVLLIMKLSVMPLTKPRDLLTTLFLLIKLLCPIWNYTIFHVCNWSFISNLVRKLWISNKRLTFHKIFI